MSALDEKRAALDALIRRQDLDAQLGKMWTVEAFIDAVVDIFEPTAIPEPDGLPVATVTDFCRWCGNVVERFTGTQTWRHVRPDYAEGCTAPEPRGGIACPQCAHLHGVAVPCAAPSCGCRS